METSKIINSLKIADALTVGEVLHARKVYSTLQSARVNAQKKLNQLADEGAIERIGGFYRTLQCKSNYEDHARFLTKILAEILKLHETIIYREHTIQEISLRPDAICLLTKDNQGMCLILEALINEPPEYFQMKVNTWNNWPEATQYLSNLFKYRIPHYEIIPVTVLDDFISYLKEVI